LYSKCYFYLLIFEGGGPAIFIKGIKSIINFLKRFGKKGVAKLRKLNKKQLKELFD